MTLHVARLAAEGMRNQEIALKLNLAEDTVRNYLIRIFDKLGISSRVELVLCLLLRLRHRLALRLAQALAPPAYLLSFGTLSILLVAGKSRHCATLQAGGALSG